MDKIKKHLDMSIIIVSWNTASITCDCIQSIYDKASDVNYEIILVDNASDDDSVNRIKNKFPDVKIIENTENKGFATANNQGMAIAQGRYYLLLNSDTILLENALKKVIDYSDLHPEIGILGCKVLNADYSLQSTLFKYPSLMQLLLSTIGFNRFKDSYFSGDRYPREIYEEENDVDVVAGCFMLVRRAAIDQVGMMDEKFFMYAEEADWCCQIQNSGWKIRYAPVAEILHLIGKSSNQVRPQMTLCRRAGILHFIKKHRSWLVYYIACFLTSLWFLVRILPWFVKGLVLNQGRKHSMVMLRTYLNGSVLALFGWRALGNRK